MQNKSHLYLAAVDARDEKLYATGSRTAAYVGVGETLNDAELCAELEISRVKGTLFHRKDIGTTALIKQRTDAMLKLRSK